MDGRAGIMVRLLCVLILLALSGCVTVDRLGTTDNFAKCAAADVGTTALGLSLNRMHEIDPLAKALYIKALGPVGGYVVPVIALSIAGYYALKWLDRPRVTATAAAATCIAAGRNLYLIR